MSQAVNPADPPRPARTPPNGTFPSPGQAAACLDEAGRDGHAGRRSIDELLPVVYDELRALAACHLRGERANHTLSPTALAHEAYLRLAGPAGTRWDSRAHFFAMAATVIRRVLLKHARGRRCAKRGGGWRRIDLRDADQAFEIDGVDLVALDEALTRLGRIAPQKRRVVELRFFTGLGVDETAEALGVSPRTVARDWRFARAWLRCALGAAPDGD